MKVETRFESLQDTTKFSKCFEAGLTPWWSLISKYEVCSLVTEEAFKNSCSNVLTLSLEFFVILCKAAKKTKPMLHTTQMCKHVDLGGLECSAPLGNSLQIQSWKQLKWGYVRLCQWCAAFISALLSTCNLRQARSYFRSLQDRILQAFIIPT